MPKLRKYQQSDLQWLAKRDCAIYSAAIGTGKTAVAIAWFKKFRKAGTQRMEVER